MNDGTGSVKDVVDLAALGMNYLADESYWDVFQSNKSRCGTILSTALDLALLIAMLTDPYEPELADMLKQQLNVRSNAHAIPKFFRVGMIPEGHRLRSPRNVNINMGVTGTTSKRPEIKKKQRSQRLHHAKVQTQRRQQKLAEQTFWAKNIQHKSG